MDLASFVSLDTFLNVTGYSLSDFSLLLFSVPNLMMQVAGNLTAIEEAMPVLQVNNNNNLLINKIARKGDFAESIKLIH